MGGAGGENGWRLMVVIGVNSRIWRPVSHGLPIKIIEDHEKEKEVETSCRDGNFKHLLELANTKWRAVRARPRWDNRVGRRLSKVS